MANYKKETRISASAEVVFGFHEAPEAFERLQPPWQTVDIIQPPASLAVGTRVVLRMKVGPFWQRVVAEHKEYEPGHLFADEMLEGPFAYWYHRHIVTPVAPDACTLTDDITYRLPLGALGRIFGDWYARRELERLFTYRHDVTRQACEGAPGGPPESSS